MDEVSPESYSTRIINALNKSEEVLPTAQKKDKVTELWKEDTEFNDLLNARNKLMRGTPEYKSITKLIKKRTWFLRNEKIKTEADEINLYADRKEVEKLYRSIKRESTVFQNLPRKEKCDPKKLTEYFAQHFSEKKI